MRELRKYKNDTIAELLSAFYNSEVDPFKKGRFLVPGLDSTYKDEVYLFNLNSFDTPDVIKGKLLEVAVKKANHTRAEGFRSYLYSSMNDYFKTEFTQEDFKYIESFCIRLDYDFTSEFIKSGFDIDAIRIKVAEIDELNKKE